MYDPAHVAGRDPHDLHDLLIAQISWVRGVLCRSGPTFEELDDLDHDVSVRRVECFNHLVEARPRFMQPS